MSERAPHYEKGEIDPYLYGEKRKNPEAQKTPEHHESVSSAETIEELLKQIEREAHSSKEVLGRQEHDKQREGHAHLAGDHLKSHASRQTLKTVQRQLNRPERTFSKIVHNPAVENVSEVAGKTVARPYGLLWGGIFSVLGSLLVVIVTRFYGYEYNFVIGLSCFAGGFLFGLLFEVVFRKKLRQ